MQKKLFKKLLQIGRAGDNKTRQRLLTLINAGEYSVNELVDRINEMRSDGEKAYPQPHISNHLGILKAAGLVTVEEKGSKNIYLPMPNLYAHLILTLDRVKDPEPVIVPAEPKKPARAKKAGA
jgi:DNA-binding transcriptional ArsR family regulator